MLKFLKSITNAVKEGIEEGAAEARAELAAEKALSEETNAELDRKYTELTPDEIFAVSLGSPLRELFVGDLQQAGTDGRKPYYSHSMDVPGSMEKELEKYLERDFGITGRDSLIRQTLHCELLVYVMIQAGTPEGVDPEMEHLLAEVEEEAGAYAIWDRIADIRANFRSSLRELSTAQFRQLLALWMVRLSYMVTVGTGIGYIGRHEAYKLLSGIATAGFSLFASWQEYADAYIGGEKEDGTNNILGRKFLAKNIKVLLEDSESPWNKHPWPVSLPQALQQ